MEIGLVLDSTAPAHAGGDFAVTSRGEEERGFHWPWVTELPRAGSSRKELRVGVRDRPQPVDREAMLRYREAGADPLVLFALDARSENRDERLDRYADTLLVPARAL